VHPKTIAGLMDVVFRIIERQGKCVIANHNLHSLYLFHNQPKFRAFYRDAACPHIEGMPIVVLRACTAIALRGREERAPRLDQSPGPPNGKPSDSQTWFDPQTFLVQHSQQTGKSKAIAICGRWRLAGPCPGFARCVHDGASNQQRRGCRRRWDIQHVQHPDRGNNLKVVRQ
jgi:hypothetical protein